MILHAGLVSTYLDGFWRGVLIEGASGAGKSDLALRMLDQGFRLVADDRVLIWASGGALYGRAPQTLANLIEVRGLGICPEQALPFSRIVLAARCEPAERRVEYPGRFNPSIGSFGACETPPRTATSWTQRGRSVSRRPRGRRLAAAGWGFPLRELA